MELDDLKSAWAQYDKKLSKNLEINLELLKKINVNRSKLELQKPLMTEVTGVVSMFIMTGMFIALSFRFIDEPKFAIPGFISTGIALVYFVFALIKMNKFLNIGYYGTSVTDLQKDIAEANRLVLKFRKYELLFSPTILISLPPIWKAVHHVDLYQNTQSFLITALVCFGIGFPATLWINKYLYDKKFQNADKLLQEIEDYKLEEPLP
jgi:hypothetical protein